MSEAMWIIIGILTTWIMQRELKWKSKAMIKVQGHLNGKWKDCFEGMDISYEGNNTILTGDLKDEAHMYEILNIVREYNLILISVNSVKVN